MGGLVRLDPPRLDECLKRGFVALLVLVKGILEDIVAGNNEIFDDTFLRAINQTIILEVGCRPQTTGYTLQTFRGEMKEDM